jgi:tripartite-type tricarboxylate transporter receptor subunit TctC
MKLISRLLVGLLFLSIAVVLVGAAGSALAQSYPNKPVRIIVTYPPGAASDILARVIGQKLTERWHQQVVVENRAGGNTVIGTEMAAKAAPDGYTLFMGQVMNLVIVPCLYSKLPYDTLKDFAPVTFIGYGPLILVVYPGLPVKSVKELIDLAKAKPGKLNFSSSGSGGSTHLAGELLKSMTGIDMVHIPYKGGTAPLIDIMSGRVELGFESIVKTLPHVKSGKLRALAITSAKRSPAAPDVPTVAEAGVPGFEVAPWFGVAAPAGTPKEIVTSLNTEINKIIRYPEVIERLSNLGVEPAGTTPEQFASHIKAEKTKWAQVVKDSGARID